MNKVNDISLTDNDFKANAKWKKHVSKDQHAKVMLPLKSI